MRILHALHGFPPEHDGGTELYVQRLAAAQLAQGHEVAVAAGSYSDRYPEFREEPSGQDGLRLFKISQKGLWCERWDHGASPFVEGEFARLLDALRPELVHVHHWLRLTRTLIARAAAEGVPAVFTAHDLLATCPRIFRVRAEEAFCERPLSVASCVDCVPRETWMGDGEVAVQIERFVADTRRELELAAVVVAPSAAHARVLSRFTELPEERFEVVPHAALVDWEPEPRGGPAWSPGCGRPLRVAHWGHMLPFKGPHVLLEAVRALGRPDVEVLLWGRAGDPDYGARLDELSAGLRVEREQTFTAGELRGLRADVAVFPSLAHESHSFVLDEAFVLGLPVLASDRGALPERISGGGATFPAGDAVALSGLLGRILDEPGWLESLRERVPGVLGFDEHWKRLESVYERATSAPPAAGDGSPDRALGWERLARELEGRARDLGGLHAAAEEEVRALRGDVAQLFTELEDKRRVIEELQRRVAELEARAGKQARPGGGT